MIVMFVLKTDFNPGGKKKPPLPTSSTAVWGMKHELLL